MEEFIDKDGEFLITLCEVLFNTVNNTITTDNRHTCRSVSVPQSYGVYISHIIKSYGHVQSGNSTAFQNITVPFHYPHTILDIKYRLRSRYYFIERESIRRDVCLARVCGPATTPDILQKVLPFFIPSKHKTNHVAYKYWPTTFK